jgi:ferric-dicitrate binding protein FerR (iron transport regulator)
MSRKNPEEYQIEDFVTDESFINYHFRLNEDDAIFWEKWLMAHPHNQELVKKAKEMLGNLSLTLSDDEYNDELKKITRAIHHEASQPIKKTPSVARLLRWKNISPTWRNKKTRYLKILLPSLLVLLLGAYIFRTYIISGPEQLIEKYNDSSKPIVMTLSDGTDVTLAPQSIFRYPSHFGNKDRKVYLDGEAQFHVNRDEAHPFKVYSGDVVATVLGTVFNVKKQRGDTEVLVELIKGKLQVEAVSLSGESTQTVTLNPDERVLYKHNSHKLFKEKWQSQNESPVPVNHLVFRQNNFEEISKQLKSVFGVTVINQSNKNSWRFTGEFKNSSAIAVVESICIVEHLQYEVKGDSIFIK